MSSSSKRTLRSEKASKESSESSEEAEVTVAGPDPTAKKGAIRKTHGTGNETR
jgi:hypothetical protein